MLRKYHHSLTVFTLIIWYLVSCSATSPQPQEIPRGTICDHGKECVNSPEIGEAAVSWCVLDRHNKAKYCSRVSCATPGGICATGGTCEAPDLIDQRYGYAGHCKKDTCNYTEECGIGFVCSSNRCERSYVTTDEFWLNQ